MKMSIKLVLFYFAFQILGVVLAMILSYGYSYIRNGNLDADYVQTISLAPAMLFGFLFMGIYLWKAGYISTDKFTWSPVSFAYLVYTIFIYAATVVLIDFVMPILPEIPDFLEDTFDVLQAGWLGILCIAVLGPILEELLFRGAITRVLLEKYSPAKAVIISALIFGIFHINPAQVVSAFLIGLLLAWLYYKTASLIPCILVHILNNSLSVYLSLNYPEVETTADLFYDKNMYILFVAGALLLFALMFIIMWRMSVQRPWREDTLKKQA